jgi:ferredoxin
MTYVVTENCTDCRFTDCVEVCPVSAFHGGDNRVYIDPEACIDCGACAPLCPVRAIFEDFELSGDSEQWVGINAEKASLYPAVRKKQTPLPEAVSRKAALGFA